LTKLPKVLDQDPTISKIVDVQRGKHQTSGKAKAKAPVEETTPGILPEIPLKIDFTPRLFANSVTKLATTMIGVG
jgi:hypothetical protein